MKIQQNKDTATKWRSKNEQQQQQQQQHKNLTGGSPK